MKKVVHTFGDFIEQVFKLFGGNITELSFDDICTDVRKMLS